MVTFNNESGIRPELFHLEDVVDWQKGIPEPDNPHTLHDFKDCPKEEATHFTYYNGLVSCDGKKFVARGHIEQIIEIHLQTCDDGVECAKCHKGAYCHHLVDKNKQVLCSNCGDAKNIVEMHHVY